MVGESGNVGLRGKTMSRKEVIYNTFSEVDSAALRAWNQLHYAKNLDETHGEDVSSRYFNMLTKAEQENVFILGVRILVRGEDFVHKEVMAYE